QKRALIARLVLSVHKQMVRNPQLIVRAWAKTGLLNPGLAPEIDEEPTVLQVPVPDIQTMIDDERQELPEMDVDEPPSDQDEPESSPEEYQQYDLYGSESFSLNTSMEESEE